MFLQKNDEILKNAPDGSVYYCLYDYGDAMFGLYLNCENEFFDDKDCSWVDMNVVDDYFHSIRRIQDIKTIVKYEQWIAAMADEHKQIPDWVQQSAKSLLANSAT